MKFITDDGKEFDDIEKAKKHEAKLSKEEIQSLTITKISEVIDSKKAVPLIMKKIHEIIDQYHEKTYEKCNSQYLDTFLEILYDLENENIDYSRGGTPRNVIVDNCEIAGIPDDEISLLIKELKEKGELYSPGRVDGIERLKLVGSK